MLFGNSKTLINIMPELNISFSSNVRMALFTLVVIEDHVWFEDRWMVASLCDE
jgi:hypothetical protein